MKQSRFTFLSFLALTLIAFVLPNFAVKAEEPWKPNQLLNPAELNKTLNNPKLPQPYIFSVGYQAIIKNSIDIGAGGDAASIKKLSQKLSKLPKDANIVIYCGCCPFERCPNVRPVFKLLNTLGFKNHKLLNLPKNVKSDWIDKGYAINK